jgi:hypothetical protein
LFALKRKEHNVELPPFGEYAVAVMFMSKSFLFVSNENPQLVQNEFERMAAKYNLKVNLKTIRKYGLNIQNFYVFCFFNLQNKGFVLENGASRKQLSWRSGQGKRTTHTTSILTTFFSIFIYYTFKCGHKIDYKIWT